MSTSIEKYRTDLIVALRMRDVPGARIGEVVAEVESHVAETGEDPRREFGSPREYAAAVAPRTTRQLSGVVATAAGIGGVTGWLLARSVIALVRGDERLYGLPTWAAVVVAVALGGLTVWLVSKRSDAVVDPRSGRSMVPPSGRTTALVVGIPVLVLGAIAALTPVFE